MSSLREKLTETSDFIYGMELVTARGTMSEAKSKQLRETARLLVDCPQITWVSITDNAGGNPMLGPSALGKMILYVGTDVVIHLSCKDHNRNGLESEAWLLASEGFHNILALSGDAPIAGHEGSAKPVFDMDSVGLLSMLSRMNEGLETGKPAANGESKRLAETQFFPGAVVTNFKLHENEVMPQYFKLEKKIECGARFIINQVGYDSRKMHELVLYMQRRNLDHAHLIGNVFMLNRRVAQIFNQGKVPGVVVSDELAAVCKQQGESPDRGKAYFMELAAKQIAVYRGLGYRGAYLGGIHSFDTLQKILDIEKTFSQDDWKQFAREIRYSRPGEFFFLAEDPDTGLADGERLNPAYEASLETRRATRNVSHRYRMSKRTHDWLFAPGKGLHDWMKKRYESAKDPTQGPRLLRAAEYVGKFAMFGCKDCGDCSLPETGFRCPEHHCAKNQRNGPCGGTRDGKCEVNDFECIWVRAYDCMKYEGRETRMLDHAPMIQDQALRGTSSWANTYLGRDHRSKASRKKRASAEKPDATS